MIRALALIALLVASTVALGEIRIVTLNKSLHFSDKPYNESHSGIGIELPVTQGLYLGLMQYENSFYNQSNMVSLTAEYPYKSIFWGPMAAVADGYGDDQDNLQMIAGVVVRYKFLRVTFTPVLIAAGLVFEF